MRFGRWAVYQRWSGALAQQLLGALAVERRAGNAASGTFTPSDLFRMNTVTPASSAASGVRFVRFTMVAPQVFQLPGAECPGPFSGCFFLDTAEVAVYGTPS
jgi:hypothetical protein